MIQNGLARLLVNLLLTLAAQEKASDMAAKGYFAHTSPDGTTPWYWSKNFGYSFAYAGENLAAYFNDFGDVERAWMTSPNHRANILSPDFTDIGIAMAEEDSRGQKTFFILQMFGKPATTTLPSRKPQTGLPRR